MARPIRARGLAALLLAPLAMVLAGRSAAAPGTLSSYVTQTPPPDFVIDGGPPVLYVTQAEVGRQVFLSWKPLREDVVLAARTVANSRRDSCVVEWTVGDGEPVRETWWLDRARGLAVCPDPGRWYERTWGHAEWNLRSPALHLDSFGGGYDPAVLDYTLDDAARGLAHEGSGAPGSAGGDSSGAAVEHDSVYVDELPEAGNKIAPEYPADALARGVEGTVVLKALIDSSGTVTKTLVIRSFPLLDAAAVQAVRQWRFRPARRNGLPLTVWVVIPVTFRLH